MGIKRGRTIEEYSMAKPNLLRFNGTKGHFSHPAIGPSFRIYFDIPISIALFIWVLH